MEVKSGQCLHVTGENGAGKSSLLKLLTGLLNPDDGKVIRPEPENLFYIGHKPGVNLLLNGKENLAFWCHLNNIEAHEKDEQILLELGLGGLEDTHAGQLSAGQQRRIALARLWKTQASLWILDEPYTSLDVQLIARLNQRFRQHLDNGGAIIMTSHQPVEIPGVEVENLHLKYQF